MGETGSTTSPALNIQMKFFFSSFASIDIGKIVLNRNYVDLDVVW